MSSKIQKATLIALIALIGLQPASAFTIRYGNSGNTSSGVNSSSSGGVSTSSSDYKGPPSAGSRSGNTSTGVSSGGGNTSSGVGTTGSSNTANTSTGVSTVDPAYKGPPSGSTANTSTGVSTVDPAYKGPPQISQCGNTYYPSDIDGHWAEIYIRRLYDLCIVEGYSDGTFRPQQNINRVELTKMALLSAGIPGNDGCYDADCGSPFMDLDLWHGKWVRPAWDRKIIQGYSRTIFAPGKAITRAEAIKIILATYGVSPVNTSKSYFNDVRGWSVGWIEKAHQLGIASGVGNGNFDPQRPITRAEAAKVIAKMHEYAGTHDLARR